MVRLKYPGPISPTAAAAKAAASPSPVLGDGVGRNHRQMSRRYSDAIKNRLHDKLSTLILDYGGTIFHYQIILDRLLSLALDIAICLLCQLHVN